MAERAAADACGRTPDDATGSAVHSGCMSARQGAVRRGTRPRLGARPALAGRAARPAGAAAGHGRRPGAASSAARPAGPGRADPAEVVDLLAAGVEPGLMAMPSGRFFGWVIGGTLPAALGRRLAGQRLGPERRDALRHARRGRGRGGRRRLAAGPARPAGRGRASASSPAPRWPTSPASPPAGQQVLADAGWDVDRHGLAGGTAGRTCSSARERHDTRRPGAALPRPRRADARSRPTTRDASCRPRSPTPWRPPDGPTIVCLQAGNLHSGAFDPFAEAIALAHEHGAWVHVDGAFGLWAAASPGAAPPGRRRRRRRLVGHRRAQDPQRALRLRDLRRRRPASRCGRRWACTTSYLVRDADGRRPVRQGARSCPAGPAACRCGRRCGRSAARGRRPGRPAGRQRPRHRRRHRRDARAPRCSTTSSSPRCASSFGDDERTRAVTARLLADGDGLDVRVALARTATCCGSR